MPIAQTLADAPELAVSTSPEDRKARAKLAAALILQGSSVEPVRHWTQGAARVAQALTGGLELGQISRDAALEEADFQNAIRRPDAGGPGPNMQAPGPRSRMSAVLADEPPEPSAGPSSYKLANLAPRDSQDTFRTPLDAMVPRAQGIDALKTAMAGPAPAQPAMSGMNPAGAVPVQTQAITPPAPQVAQSGPAFTPDQNDAYIERLKASRSPKAQKYGLALEQKNLTQDRYVTKIDANGNPYQQNLTTGKRESDPTAENKDLQTANAMLANPTKWGFKGADDPALAESVRKRLGGQATSVSVNNVAEPVLEGVGKQIVASRDRAQAAANQTIPAIHEARKALDEGAITGLFAGGRLDLAKGAALFGMDASKAVNTETFNSALGQQVLAHAKDLGINPSNRDVVVIQGIIGGAPLQEGSLRNILDMQERWARQSIRNFNDTGEKLMRVEPERYRAIAPLMRFEEPPEYKKAVPAAGATPAVSSTPDQGGWITAPNGARIRQR